MIIEYKIGTRLVEERKTLSVAESCSGGLLGHRLTNIPGSTAYFKGGVIVYTDAAKTKLLGVPSGLIKKHEAVSAPVAKKMAQAVRKILNTDFGVSITGIAGPTGGTKEKPVGITFIAVADSKHVFCKKFLFKGSRLKIKKAATDEALKLLLKLF